MADLVRALFIVAALVASVRARYALGVFAALGCGAILAVELFVVVRFPVSPDRLELALGALFLGPTSLPHAPPMRVLEVLMDPLHHLASALIAAVGAQRAFARASALRPESLPARRLDDAGLRFVALAVLGGLLSISGVVFHLLGGD